MKTRIYLLALISLAGSIMAQAPVVPPGYVVTSFWGTQIVMPLLATYMASWSQTIENQSLLSLVNQGDNSPAKVVAEAAAVAQTFCAGAANAPVPDCAAINGVVGPIQGALTVAAGTVPGGQWSQASYNPSMCSTIAMCFAVSSVTPPVNITGPLVNLPCQPVGAQMMCTAGTGVTSATANNFTYNGGYYNNGAVISYLGVSYKANTYQGPIAASVWFSPVASASAKPAAKK